MLARRLLASTADDRFSKSFLVTSNLLKVVYEVVLFLEVICLEQLKARRIKKNEVGLLTKFWNSSHFLTKSQSQINKWKIWIYFKYLTLKFLKEILLVFSSIKHFLYSKELENNYFFQLFVKQLFFQLFE